MEKANEQATNNGVTQHEEMNDHQEDVDLDEDAQATERLTDSDPNKVKFTSIKMDGYSDKNGDARVDIRLAQTSVGMGKEELMKYANEPYWVRLRMFLFVLFWVSWVAMLVGAIAIIALAPRCPPAPQLEWHQKTTMYRVMIKSFKDSDGDGVGDLQGLRSELHYLKSINIGTVLLSSFYETAPDSDGIVNHTSIDSRFGTMTDFEELLKDMEEKEMKLVIDFNPNDSSDKHPWFQASVQGVEPYTDFYVWHEGDKGDRPSNWLNVNGEPAWEWNDVTKKYYLHTFGKHLPDLNLMNPHVRSELKEILEFWLAKGVHGFKVTAASHLIEDADPKDEPLITPEGVTSPGYDDISHPYTVGQSANLELFAEWREVLHNFSSNVYRVLLAEVSENVNASMKYYGSASQPLADFPINVQLTHLTHKSSGEDILHVMKTWLDAMPSDTWPNWQLGSETTDRLATRVGPGLIDGMHMIAMLSRGTPITYYGDELGIDYEPIDGNVGILNQSPMQWDDEPHGGFTNGTDTYAALNPDYQTVNVKAQQSAEHSHLKIFKSLSSIRNVQSAIKFGIQMYPVVTKNIFSMIRVQKGFPGYLVVVNVGMNTTTTDFVGKSDYLPEKGRVEVRSLNIKDGPLAEGENPKVLLNNIVLEPAQAVVFSFVPVFT